jgi:hypothetical protein
MQHLRKMALTATVVALAALAGASSASATVLEVGGEAKDESVQLTMSLASGTSILLSRTDGSFFNTCTGSHASGNTEAPYSGTSVTAPLSSLSFSNCARVFSVHDPGTLHFSHIAGTTNATVVWSGAQITVDSPFGNLPCQTGAGTHIGTLTGTASGNAELHLNAVINCGVIVPSVKWNATYEITSPSGLGALKEVPPTTTLEVGGTPKGEKVEVTASLLSGSSSILSRTDGTLANTCTQSHASASTESPYHGAGVTGPISSLSFSNCTRPVAVHQAGKLFIEHIAGTTDGTVSSEEAQITVGSPFGTLNCKTGQGTDLGRLTGKASGNATLDVDAIIDCGFLVPSARWNATYEITSPSGLGVTA